MFTVIRRALVSVLLAIMAVSVMPYSQADERISADDLEFFETKIRPVLSAHCYECHSAATKVPKGSLRLDLKETTLAGGDSGPAVVPGKPSESHLLLAMRYEASEMPPKGRLPDSVIADFERWIQMGAPDPRTESAGKQQAEINYDEAAEFWAFRPPQRHEPPPINNSQWPKNDIDRFVLDQLTRKGLQPATPADRRVLIRRAYFDLIGLPPEPEAVERFVSDSSETAFEEVVDTLLASPHYGERWGRYWLDLARYAEDQAHTFKARMYPQGFVYRDWVVQALNDDMPYDQFLRLQIAADQMEMDDLYRHRPALGLFALGPVYYQDNGEQDKALADEWDDRIDTLMRGTQALTVSCARCHDHKYDPISMADYYGLAGIFASSEYRELPAVSDEVVAARQQADQAVQDQQLEINVLLAAHAPAARLKLVDRIPQYMLAASEILLSDAAQAKNRKLIEKTADAAKVDRELLQRWIAWLSEQPGSGAVGQDRPYLQAWRQFLTQQKDSKQAESDRTARVAEIAEHLQAEAASLISRRAILRKQFGDNFAFVSDQDRAVVEPGTVPLGNLFDDRSGALLSSAVTTDPFRSVASAESLGVDRVAHGWGGSAQIASGIRFDFSSIGSDSRQHGQITNDGWSAEGGIRTIGSRCAASIGRTEQGIGMHANALITFDLNEIRRSGLIPATQPMTFQVDRAGINDDSFGAGSSVHIAVIVSKPHQQEDKYDAIIAGYVDGQPQSVAENDRMYYFDGTIPDPIRADGRFVSFDVPVPPDAAYLTIVTTGAQISETENTISSDHAVLSNARLLYAVESEVVAETSDTAVPADLSDAERAQMRIEATLLSELFDERGVLGLAPDRIEPYLEPEPSATLAKLKTSLEEKQKAAAAIAVTMAHTLTDGKARDLKIYLAGDPKKQGAPAERSFPAIMTSGRRQPFETDGSGRRQLAEAIASDDNPLTARVIVNRVWAGHFGYGLVRTLSNFGQLGERPSHPELLDFLAVELMESGWSLKQLHRRIMLSATWQQSSLGDESARETDPENRLLWQMNRRRLEVEPWRDAVLSVSGQLNRQVGGPSAELNKDHRRRTLYGYISRHRLNDLLRLFDFPDPNITAGERTVTNVPLQQLFVLNSEFMVSQAKALAARLQKEAETDDQQISRLFGLLFGRPAGDDEREAAIQFLASAPADERDRLTPLEQLCLAMLGTNEFVYLD